MTATPSVAVLLSTYNGAAFLDAQLKSLATQAGVALQVFARDDGSTDETLSRLAAYGDRWPALTTPITGSNLGPAASFLDLLQKAPAGFDFYAFCDQDDVWMPDKLQRAVAKLAHGASPALYCSSVLLSDSELNPLGPHAVNGDTRFDHLLFENIAFGHTVVMNAAAHDALKSNPPRQGVIMHDWWCALVISGIGEVVFDARPGALYRQHGANQVGASQSRLSEALALARRFWRDPRGFYPIHAQAAECLRLFGPRLPTERRRLLEEVVTARGALGARLRLALSGRIVRARALDALISRILVATGLY